MAETGQLQLLVKASEDGESVGHCPSCQRLFMILLLKGVPFTLTTVDTRRSPEVLKDFAPGSQLPILLCEGDAKTDTLQIEEFLEETLGPPEFPSLAPRYRESTTAGNDVFHKFSAFIKNPVPAQDDALYQQLLRALTKLDSYLRAPLEHELGREPQLRESRRRFLDGDQLTLADCGLLPKLHVVNTVCAHFRQAPIPAELRGVHRYLDCALQEKEFKYTCPHSAEILAAYRPVVRPRRPHHLPTHPQPHKGTSAPVSAKGHRRDQRPLSFCHSQTPTVGCSAPDNSPQESAEKPVGGVRSIALLLREGGTGLGSQTSQARVGPQEG